MATTDDHLPAREAILDLHGITKSFGRLRAVGDVSFAVPEGSAFGVIGPNGAGKTTLFNIISGLLPPNEGSIMFDRVAIERLPAYKRARLGMTRTFQVVRLAPDLTVLQNVMLGAHCALDRNPLSAVLTFPAVVRRERAAEVKAMEAIDYVGLGPHAGRPVGELPHGLQRLVEIARATVSTPRVLMLDEPAAGLNATETTNLFELLKGMKARGITVLVVEHDMHFIMTLCDRLVVLDHGQKIAEGTPNEVRGNAAVIEAYLGRKHGHA